jgi:hypothetical protein
LQLGGERDELRLGVADFLARHLGHFGVGQQLAGRSQVGLVALIAAVAFDQAMDLGLLLGERAVALHVGRGRAVGQGGIQLGQAHGQAFELLTQGVFHRGRRGGRRVGVS